MLKLSMPVVVEGKYDRKRLKELIDAPIFETGGFRIYHDKEKLALFRAFAKQTGLIIATDSDAAGFQIRNYLKSAVKEGKLYHVYIPDVYGKERRKAVPSKEGKLGVEGIDPEILRQCFLRAGVLPDDAPAAAPGEEVTSFDLYDLGFSGRENAAQLRKRLCLALGFPENMTIKGLLPAINAMFTREEFFVRAKECLQKEEG